MLKKSIALLVLLMASAAASAQATDLSVFKDTLDESGIPVVEVAPGSEITYSIDIKDSAEGVNGLNCVLTDNVPSLIDIVSATSTQGTCNVSGQTVTCDLGTIADGSTVTVTIVGVLLPIAGLDTEIDNTATVTASNEIDPVDNSSTSTFVVGSETIEDPDSVSSGCALNAVKHRTLAWNTMRRALLN